MVTMVPYDYIQLQLQYEKIYPLVNAAITLENHHAVDGKAHELSTGPFSIAF